MNKTRLKQFFEGFYYSFPIQLLINHLKKNQVLLLLWVMMFGFITKSVGMMVGAPYLFLDPEYINTVDYRGFLLIGISLAIFIMSFHITTYILDSYRFSFLGTIAKPFTKFCLNNSIIPLAFVIVYIISIIKFQSRSMLASPGEIILDLLGFLGGLLGTLFVMIIYFRSTNKDIFKELALNLDKQLRKNSISRVNVMKKLKTAKKDKYRVNYYVDFPLRFLPISEYKSYDKQTLLKIFDQNHLNAVIVEIFVIILIVILGLFRDNSYFQIPSAASGILFFSMFIMFTGAFSYWLRGWAITTLFIALIIFNFLVKHQLINSNYQAYGLNYNTEQAEYSLARLNELSSEENYLKDTEETIGILENWKKKFGPGKKPKLVLLCVSGGGQRAAAWTLRTLQFTDSSTQGGLFKHTCLVTGASGGIVGASYFRQLYLEKMNGKDINVYNPAYYSNITKDILNPVIFSLVVNDVFFRFQKFSYGKYEYLKDRGYAFEQQLNRNTEYIMNKKVSDLKEPEQQGMIPMVLLAPTIINDGRKLYISPQHVSYMTRNYAEQSITNKIKGIEFLRFYEEQDSKNLSFLSALRMSATFPYITPNVELPSNPAMEIMDAGLSDNYGIRDAVKFLYVFKDWIMKNTGGVVIVSIRDSEKNKEIEKKVETSIFQKMFTPIGSLYNNWDYMQDLNNDNVLEFAQSLFQGKMEMVEFQYIPSGTSSSEINTNKEQEEQRRAALSWHLTTREKENIKSTILRKHNIIALEKLKQILDAEN